MAKPLLRVNLLWVEPESKTNVKNKKQKTKRRFIPLKFKIGQPLGDCDRRLLFFKKFLTFRPLRKKKKLSYGKN